MKLYIIAIVVLIGAILATASNASSDIEPEDKEADPILGDLVGNVVKGVQDFFGGLGRADMRPEERN